MRPMMIAVGFGVAGAVAMLIEGRAWGALTPLVVCLVIGLIAEIARFLFARAQD